MSSNLKLNRICIYCNNDFIAQTTTTKYCSKKCNSAHYKAKIRAKKVKASNIETEQKKVKPVTNIQSKEFLKVSEVSQLLNCSKRTAYRLIENGTLKAVNLSERMTRISRSDVNKLLKQEAPQPTIEKPKPIYSIKEPEQIQFEIKDCLTIGEVQNNYGVSEKALYQVIKRYNIPKLQQGKFVYVPKLLIEEILT